MNRTEALSETSTRGAAVLPSSAVPLIARSVGFALLLIAELVGFSVRFDTQSIDGKPGLTGLLADAGPYIVNLVLAFAALFAALSYSKIKPEIHSLASELVGSTPDLPLLAGHFAALAAFFLWTKQLFALTFTGDGAVLVWILLALLEVVLALLAFIPFGVCQRILRITGLAWLYSAIGSSAAVALMKASRLLWGPTTEATFQCLRWLLRFFTPNLIVEPKAKVIGTAKFSVSIAPACSGLEGLGLMLAFSLVWLWLSRKEVILPRAVAVIPFVVAAMFPLNLLRISLLLLIGNYWSEDVAVGGFHSQAGWIVFNTVAIGFCFAANRVPWLWKQRSASTAKTVEHSNPTAAYLIPFLAILAASMISRATQSDFEWLYPLRFVAAAGALFFLRREYRNLDWRFGWLGPVIGILVFGLWLGLDRFAAQNGNSGIAAGLAKLPAWGRYSWLVFRVCTAAVIVPIAEELAFRGYLARRLTSSRFEAVDFRNCSLLAVVVSSVAFGTMHGERWFAGIIAGLLYAYAVKRTGRIGEAVIAHGVTNALIAVSVLVFGQWSLW